jgi:hypothetical protein|nr:MAG TPA: hypothetical protein [Caudoviricetes sp.]
MGENRYWALFDVPAPEEGGNEQEAADPATQTEETTEETVTGGNEQEAADPATEEQGNPGEAQEAPEPEEKDEQDPETRRKNAAQRRIREKQEAEQKGRRDAAAEIFRQMNLQDPKTGKTVTTMEEFAAYQQAKVQAKAEEDLKKGKLSQEVLQSVLMASPEMQAVLQNARETKETAEVQDFTARREMELAEIRKINPEIKTLDDIIRMPTGGDFADLVRKGCSFVQAYKTANFEAIMQKNRAAGEQRARNAAMSQAHIKGTPKSQQEAFVVPQQVREMYRKFNPDITDEEIAKDYRKRK